VAIVAGLVFYRRKLAVIALVGLLLVGAGSWFAVSPHAWERISDIDTEGTGRSELWAVGWQIFEEHPVIGVGLNNFRSESYRYVRRPGRLKYVRLIVERPDVVHNAYLQLLVEGGVIGLALFLTVIGACLRATWMAGRQFRAVGRGRLADLSFSVLVASLGMLSASFFLANATDSRLWVLLALGPALLAMARRVGPPAAIR